MTDTQDAAPPAPEPAPHAAPSLEERLLAVVLAWRNAHIAGGPIGRAVDCWNHLDGALKHLVAALAKEF